MSSLAKASPVQTTADLLTPEALRLLHRIVETGSFAAAARASGVVPSTLTYRVQQIEQALDVLLFDRRSHQAHPTDACNELLRESRRLLAEIDAIAQRVRRVATGWESKLTISVDAIINRTVVLELCDAFLALGTPTRIKLRYESLNGTLEALTSGQADLAIGVVSEVGNSSQLRVRQLGFPQFAFVVAPHHPLATQDEPLGDELIRQHRAIAVADSTVSESSMTIGLMKGQEVLTVPDMQTMRDAIARGLGIGFLPLALAQPLIESGRLVAKSVERQYPPIGVNYAWKKRKGGYYGKALQWWLDQLEGPICRNALLR